MHILCSLHYIFQVFFLCHFCLHIVIISCYVVHKEIHRTRSDEFCLAFSAPETFNDNFLPIYEDDRRSFLYIQALLRENNQEPGLAVVCSPFIKHLNRLWAKSSIPILTYQHLLYKVREYQGNLNFKKA